MSGSTGRCYVSSEIMRRFLKLMLVRSLRLQSANAEYAAGYTTKDKRQDRTWQKEDEAEAKKESGDYMEVPDMVNREMEDNRDE